MEQVFTEHMVDDVQPQDLAMDLFRAHFKLVADCYVTKDGKIMTYQMKTLAGAARWLSEANAIITANKMPLNARVRAQKKGMIDEKVELIITYKS